MAKSKILKGAVIGAISLVGIYAIAGYLVVPIVAKSVIGSVISKQLNAPVEIEKVSFNPWSWRFELDNLSAKSQATQTELVRLHKVVVDASAETLTRFAPVLTEVTVDGLHVAADMKDPQVSKLFYGANDDTAADDATTADTTTTQVPKFAVYNISLLNSSFKFDDPASNIHQSISDINLQLPFVSTIASSEHSLVTPVLRFKLNGTPIEATGSTSPFGATLQAQLNLRVRNLDLVPLSQLVPEHIRKGVNLGSGKLNTDLTFVFKNANGDQPSTMLLSGSAQVSQVAVNGAMASNSKKPATNEAVRLLSLASLNVKVNEANLTTQKVDIDNVTFQQLNGSLTRTKSGDFLGLQKMLDAAVASSKSTPKAAATPTSTTTDASSDAWKWTIRQAAIKRSSFQWQDLSVTPNVKLGLTNLNATIRNMGNESGDKGEFDLFTNVLGGSVTLSGNAMVAPMNVTLNATTNALDFTKLGPYVKAASGFDVGAQLNTNIQAYYKNDNFLASGAVSVNNIAVSGSDLPKNTIANVSVQLRRFDLNKQLVDIESIRVSTPKLAYTLKASEKAKGSATTSAKKTASTDSPTNDWRVDIDKLQVTRGSVTLKDQSITPAATLSVANLTTTLTNFSTKAGTQAKVNLSANVAKGSVSAKGNFVLSPMATNLDVTTKNLSLASLNNFLVGYTTIGAKAGTINTSNTFALSTLKNGTSRVSVKGDVAATNVNLTKNGNSLISWKTAALTGVDFANTTPIHLKIASAELASPLDKQVDNVKKITEGANAILGLLGGSKKAESILGKVDNAASKVENKVLKLENIQYVNGQFSANGSTVEQAVLNVINKALGKTNP